MQDTEYLVLLMLASLLWSTEKLGSTKRAKILGSILLFFTPIIPVYNRCLLQLSSIIATVAATGSYSYYEYY